MKKFKLLLLLPVFLLSFDLPQGWYKAGSKPKSYDMGIDKGAGRDGKNAATIRSLDNNISGFGTLMQECRPGKYAGKRVRMSAWVKTENVASWSGLWFRVDSVGRNYVHSFDNMQNRAIKGTTAWAKYEIVLDVPAAATRLAYGALIDGTGQIWFDDLQFEVVDETVPTTGIPDSAKKYLQDEPANLDFEK